MGFLRNLFGKRKEERAKAPATRSAGHVSSHKGPEAIKVFDEYGHEMMITRQEWRDKILLGNLAKHSDDPDQLYSMLVSALNDGFAADVIEYAEQLARIDHIPSRAATILGIAYMQVDRLDDAERTLRDFIAERGEEGVVLTNLAKILAAKGDNPNAEATLWHALELDPNQDNGLAWFVAINNERGGEASVSKAIRRVAALPTSWRAQLWLARDALARLDLATAQRLYDEALSRAERPVPADLLMQMSGDLGMKGYMAEAVTLTEPHYDATTHGLEVGNNLIKAMVELDRPDDAQTILNDLHAMKRPDWQQTLAYWDTELAKIRVANTPKPSCEHPEITLVSIDGPLWARPSGPFGGLLPKKAIDAPRVAVVGSMVMMANTPKPCGAQLADSPGRLSRAIPLLLGERIHLLTNGLATTLVPWCRGMGFAVLSRTLSEQELLQSARATGNNHADFLVATQLDTREKVWAISITLLRVEDGRQLAEAQTSLDPENPGPGAMQVTERCLEILAKHAEHSSRPARPGTPSCRLKS